MGLASAILFATLAVPLLALATSSSLQVKTDAGAVEGAMRGTASSPVRTFLGIPYAAPPVGDLRWRPPPPPAKWPGTRPATKFGPRCMQGHIYADMVFRDAGISEDCLTLNVWTPARQSGEKLPVIVWIYGGGFVTGGTSEARQDGEILAQQNVVVVSMNYRVGIFGFFVLPELATESPHHAAGNYGLLDQLAALQWVHRNIEAFGGDPANVTIAGESAGSFSVSALMASPLAKGLFHKAIGESGGAFYSKTLSFDPLDVREKADTQFAASHLSAQSLKQLRAIPAQTVLDASLKLDSDSPRFIPNIDGYLLPQPVPAIFASGNQSDVPLLAGWNRDEGGFAVLSAPHPPTPESMQTMADKEFGANAAAFLRLYPSSTAALARRSAADLAGDSFIAWSAWNWLEAQSATGKQPIYRYRFDLAPPSDAHHPRGSGAYHSAEIRYVFGTLDLTAPGTSRIEDRKLSDLMQRYWANFARTGNPNSPGLLEWPAYGAASGWQGMHLDATSKAGKDALRQRYLFLNSVWRKK